MNLSRAIPCPTLLTIAMGAAAQGVATVATEVVGTWLGETSGIGGLAVMPIALIINPDGSGTMATGDTVHELEDVTIDAPKIVFGIRPLLGGTRPAGFRFRYEGNVEDETMTLDMTVEGRDDVGGGAAGEPLVLRRQAPGRSSLPRRSDDAGLSARRPHCGPHA